MTLKNNKSLGQHWLKNRDFLDYIAELALFGPVEKPVENSETTPETDPESVRLSRVVEIGPGLGTLTSALLRVFPEATAVELDEKLAKNLPNSFPGKNLTVINENFLDFDLEKVVPPYAVAGNTPYYITSPIIAKLLSAKNLPRRVVLLIQKEVAERIAAGKGNHTFLSLSAQNRADVFLGPVVGREFFTPPPKVDSQVICLEPKAPVVPEEVIKFIKLGFSSPRKKLIKNLPYPKEKLISAFEELGFSENIRPADLDLLDYQKLYNALIN